MSNNILSGSILVDKFGQKMEVVDAVAREGVTALSEEIEQQAEQCYSISEMPIYLSWLDNDQQEYPNEKVQIHDVRGYGLCTLYAGKRFFGLNPMTLELKDLCSITLTALNGKSPDWYCGKLAPRYIKDYDNLYLWERKTKTMVSAATNGVIISSHEGLGWLRNTGMDFRIGSGGTAQGAVIYAEYWLPDYDADNTIGKVRVMRSTNQGSTWNCVFEQNTRNSDNPEVYHFHFVRKDPFNDDHWYLGSGDNPDECNIWRSIDDGLTWTKINDPNYSGNLQSIHRACNLYFTEDYIYWGTDDSVDALNQGKGLWVRSPRNLDSNELDIEVLADVKDWVRITQETPYGVLIATEKRFNDNAWVWLAPYDDLTHPVLIAKTEYGFSSQIHQHSYGSRLFFAHNHLRGYPDAYDLQAWCHVMELSRMSRLK